MADIFNILEERSRTWHALQRQHLAGIVWPGYVATRFGRTGDPRALEFLYPYLNHASRSTRLVAVRVAAKVFEGRGPRAIESLDYFTKHPDPFLKDRAVMLIGAALTGCRDEVILEHLASYLNHRNQFIRTQALVALGEAGMGQASQRVLTEIQRVASLPGPKAEDVTLAVARAFTGKPTEEAYHLTVRPEIPDRVHTDGGEYIHAGILVKHASQEWYERACTDAFDPFLHIESDQFWERIFAQRDGVDGLSEAGEGRGMDPLMRMWHLRSAGCAGNAMYRWHTVSCFDGADRQANYGPIVELLRTSDVSGQRIAAVCLGKLMEGAEDAEAIELLVGLCDARNKAVQAAALRGIGMVAKSTCDERLRQICQDRAMEGETARDAINTLGSIFYGSARSDVFESLRQIADGYRNRPVRGKKHCGPLALCYRAIGWVYAGTGSTEPLEFFVDIVSRPRLRRYDEYQDYAAIGLLNVQFPTVEWVW